MSTLLKGAPAAAVINEKTASLTASLKEAGISASLAIVRVGERADDLAYENSIVRKSQQTGINTVKAVLPADCSQKELEDSIDRLNNDDNIHGIILMRPLPAHLDETAACNLITASKDVDGCSNSSLSALFTSRDKGFGPCTAEAVIEILDYYGIPVEGKKVTVIGRSLVIGKPVAMMLLNRNATVTIAHSRSTGLEKICRESDIVVTAVGKPEFFGRDYFREGQTVIDVGMNYSEKKNKMCGDVSFDEVSDIVDSITPVPSGVGAVTVSVLLKHVAQAAGNLI